MWLDMSSHISADGKETQQDWGDAESCYCQIRQVLQGRKATKQVM